MAGDTGTRPDSRRLLSLSSQNVGTTSAAQTVTLTNSGGAALSISSIAVTGTNSADFGQTNNIGSAPWRNRGCIIKVPLPAAASGTRPGPFTVTDEASATPP